MNSSWPRTAPATTPARSFPISTTISPALAPIWASRKPARRPCSLGFGRSIDGDDMIKRIEVILVLLVVALVAKAVSAADAQWHKQTHPYRMLLDWRPDDMTRPDQTAELFLETSKF